MTEKTEEQIAKDKAAVEAMRNARSNMDAALARINDLERALGYALNYLTAAKGYIGPSAYVYGDRNQATIHNHIDSQVASLRKTLG